MRRRRTDAFDTELVLMHEHHIRVRFSEVDSMRVAWHGSYVKYFEDGREAFGLAYPGIGYDDFANSGFFAPMVEMTLNYHCSLRAGEVALLQTTYHYCEAAKILFSYRLLRDDQETLAASGRSIQVFTTHDGELYLNNPPFYEEWKARSLEIMQRK